GRGGPARGHARSRAGRAVAAGRVVAPRRRDDGDAERGRAGRRQVGRAHEQGGLILHGEDQGRLGGSGRAVRTGVVPGAAVAVSPGAAVVPAGTVPAAGGIVPAPAAAGAAVAATGAVLIGTGAVAVPTGAVPVAAGAVSTG